MFEHHWICSQLRKTPQVQQGEDKVHTGWWGVHKCLQPRGFAWWNIHWDKSLKKKLSDFWWVGMYERFMDTEVQLHQNHARVIMGQTILMFQHHTLQLQTGLSVLNTIPASCSSTVPHMLLAGLHTFLTEISGKADSLHIGFITDWELYFHKNYYFLVHPCDLRRKQINLNNWILSNWFSDAFFPFLSSFLPSLSDPPLPRSQH